MNLVDLPRLADDVPLPIRAEAVARHAHAGQVDKQNRPYADFHLAPIAAALRRFGPRAEAAGWLHDIIEDCGVTDADLLDAGIPSPVVDAVLSVSRDVFGPETYEALIARACADPLGALVKLADNACNIASNPGLAAIDPQKAHSLLHKRYLPARARLLDATGLDLDDVEAMTAVIAAVINAETEAAETEAAQA